MKKNITIKADQRTTDRLADITCWLKGYMAGKDSREYDPFFYPILDELEELNHQIKININIKKEEWWNT